MATTHNPSNPPRQSLLARALFLAALALIAPPIARAAETCTTQSGLSEPERNALADAARTLAAKIQANDDAFLRTASVAEVQKDFGSMQYLAGITSPKLAGGTPTLEQIYVLDALTLKPNPDGSAPDAQFFCSLNRSTMEADFIIPSLPPGKYGFAIVNVTGSAAPWRLSFLLRQEQGKWLLAGFYPRALTAAGHDGLWYWTQGRQYTKDKQPWNAWLYYQAATTLLRPTDFVLSSHLDKLHTEAVAAAPSALSEGVSPDAPLVVKGANGTEYHFTGLGVDDSLGDLDIAVHLRIDPPPADAKPDAKPDPKADPVANARKHNADAMLALLTAYPELRKPFHGIRMFAETPGQPTFATEAPMADIK
jgi:hypothetical protein